MLFHLKKLLSQKIVATFPKHKKLTIDRYDFIVILQVKIKLTTNLLLLYKSKIYHCLVKLITPPIISSIFLLFSTFFIARFSVRIAGTATRD